MIIDNSCLGSTNTQDERFTPFLVIKIKGNDCIDIWIRDYNPPRCFQKKISGRSKHCQLSWSYGISKEIFYQCGIIHLLNTLSCIISLSVVIRIRT
jgi:hypothetical protein